MFMSAVYLKLFSVRGHQIFTYFQAYFFGRITLKYIENKKGCEGSGGMLLQKIFENLRTVVAILVLFKQFLGKLCLNFCP